MIVRLQTYPNLFIHSVPLIALSLAVVMSPDAQPFCLLQDLGDDAGADGAAAFADRKAQPFVHRNRRDQLHRHPNIVPGITISVPSGNVTTPVTSVVRK